MVAVPSSLPSALPLLPPLLLPLLLLPVGGSSSHRADWLHECGWGVFTHFLPLNRDVPTTNAAAWNRIVDSFNATHLAEQLSDVGACYYFITIGQDSGWYLGPNKVYDEFAGYDPPHTSRRDLISDIHAALAPKNIKLGVYLPYEAPMEDANVSQKLSFRYLPHVSQDLLGGRFPLGRTLRNHSRGPWEPERYGLDDSHGEIFGHGRPYGFGTDRLVTFQTEWNKIIAAWSELYGDKVSGWWFDGCYHSYDLHDFADDDPPNFKTFADAARAGNPAAALAFNPGQVPWLPSLSVHQDFTAGEIGDAAQFPSPTARRFSNLNAQYHILSYLGPVWGCFGHNVSTCLPRFNDSTLSHMVEVYTRHGWAITWDTPVHDNGTLFPPFLQQLQKLKPFSRRAHVHEANNEQDLQPQESQKATQPRQHVTLMKTDDTQMMPIALVFPSQHSTANNAVAKISSTHAGLIMEEDNHWNSFTVLNLT